MGAECSYDRKIEEDNKTEQNSNSERGNTSRESNLSNLEFKTYRDYNSKHEQLSKRLYDIIKKAETLNEFSVIKK